MLTTIRNLSLALALVALAACASPIPASAAIHGSPLVIPAGCAFPTFQTDGCSGAQIHGTLKVADLYTYAAQSGQPWVSHHPQPWNVAGVDYFVGYDTTLTLKDPKTQKVLLPAGCTYSDTTGPQSSPQVTCGAGAISPTLTGWDFGGVSGGEGCVKLRLLHQITGTVTITNNRFRASGGCLITNGNLASVESSSLSFFDVVFKYNEVDGNYGAFVNKGTYPGVTFSGSVMTVPPGGTVNAGSKILLNDYISGPGITGDLQVLSYGTGTGGAGTYNMRTVSPVSGPITVTDGASPAGTLSWQEKGTATIVEYNHFHDIFNLPMIGNQTDTGVLTAFNVVDGFNQACITKACLHGAYWEILNDPNNAGVTSIQHSYNLLIMRNTNIGGVTASFTFLSGHTPVPPGWPGVIYDKVQIDHNTAIMNLAGDGGFSGSGALSWVGYLKNIVSWVQQDNWVDPYGARDCVENFGGTSGGTGFIDNAGGGGPGNTLRINGINAAGGGYWTGAYVHIPGVTVDRLILPAGTICDGQVSDGGTTVRGYIGSYCVDGPPVGKISSSAIATKTTPITTVVFGGTGHENKSLSNGGTITRAGNSWNTGSCPGISS